MSNFEATSDYLSPEVIDGANGEEFTGEDRSLEDEHFLNKEIGAKAISETAEPKFGKIPFTNPDAAPQAKFDPSELSWTVRGKDKRCGKDMEFFHQSKKTGKIFSWKLSMGEIRDKEKFTEEESLTLLVSVARNDSHSYLSEPVYRENFILTCINKGAKTKSQVLTKDKVNKIAERAIKKGYLMGAPEDPDLTEEGLEHLIYLSKNVKRKTRA